MVHLRQEFTSTKIEKEGTMHAEVFKGQLIYVDTEEGQIQLMDRADNRVTALNIDADTSLPGRNDWESLVGDDIDVVVIDGKTENVYVEEE